ncbi:MAG: hypothetical protein K5906_05150, partial [Bacilli bacterium]|nr:hypothetical protein [Bacilli bacterium]
MKNKVTKILALSVLGVFALTACDDIVAKPTQYSEPLITVSDYSSEIYNNVASTVYDTIQEGGVGSEVLNQILYIYAVSAFGAYNPYVKVNNSEVSSIAGAITLKAAATDSTQTDAFVLAHKAYWDSSRVDASSAVTDSERERVEAKYNSIEERIAEAMYEKISTGSYSDRHVYSEKKFVKSLRSSLESVVNPADLTDDKFYETQILPEVEPKNVFDNYLHRDYYDSENNRYIVDEIVPTIYRQLLSEQYLLEETYNTLGRSYAREVNIIKFNN